MYSKHLLFNNMAQDIKSNTYTRLKLATKKNDRALYLPSVEPLLRARCLPSSALWTTEGPGEAEGLTLDQWEGILGNGLPLRWTPAVGATDERVVIGFPVVIWCAFMEACVSKSGKEIQTIPACYITDTADMFNLIRRLPIHPSDFLPLYHIHDPHRKPIHDDVTSTVSYFLGTLTLCTDLLPNNTQTYIERNVHQEVPVYEWTYTKSIAFIYLNINAHICNSYGYNGYKNICKQHIFWNICHILYI